MTSPKSPPTINTMKNLRKIKAALPSSLGNKIIDSLREAILAGEIDPGERINEAHISKTLGVSRSPIREAIRVLEAEGLVEVIQRRGAFVKKASIKDIEEVYHVLYLLDCDAAALAAEKIKPHQKKKLKSILRKMERMTAETPFSKVNQSSRDFHRIIVEATQNSLLIKMRQQLRSQEEIFHRARVQKDPVYKSEVISEHLNIGNAIIEGRVPDAKKIMSDHLNTAKHRAINAFDNDIESEESNPAA